MRRLKDINAYITTVFFIVVFIGSWAVLDYKYITVEPLYYRDLGTYTYSPGYYVSIEMPNQEAVFASEEEEEQATSEQFLLSV